MTSPTQTPLLSVALPFDLNNGNDGRGTRWFSSAKLRKKYEETIRTLGHIRKPFNRRVRLVVTRVLGKGQRKFDPMSLGRGNWKEIEDALVACGWFHDDSWRWIDQASGFRQDDTRRDKGPYVIVEVFDAGDVA